MDLEEMTIRYAAWIIYLRITEQRAKTGSFKPPRINKKRRRVNTYEDEGEPIKVNRSFLKDTEYTEDPIWIPE